MSYCRFLLLPGLACGVVLLMGSLGMVRPLDVAHSDRPDLAPAAPFSQPVPAPDTPADPQAAATLDRALAALDPARLAWLEMNLWHQVSARGLTCTAEGKYQSAPGQRWRLDLKTRQGDTEGKLQVISDGATLWQVLRIGTGNWMTYSRVSLADVLALLDSPETPPLVRDEFFQMQARGSIVTLLPRLRRRMTWVRQEMVRRNGRLLVKLSATWTPAEAQGLVPPGTSWPADLPRQCRLYLDPETLWPHRLEWWGPDPPRPQDALLVEMEFRDPVLNQALPAEVCARAFTPDVDPSRVPDLTQPTLALLQSRVTALAKQRVH